MAQRLIWPMPSAPIRAPWGSGEGGLDQGAFPLAFLFGDAEQTHEDTRRLAFHGFVSTATA
jgi:hypothetical protein